MIKLRPYQREIIQMVEDGYLENPSCRLLVQLPTGMGKTVVFSSLIKGMGCQTLVIAHREELLFQAKNKILAAGILEEQIDIVLQSRPNPAAIHIASIQTIIRGERLSQIHPELIIIDEAHHAIAESYKTVINAFPGVPVIGFTATPIRTSPKEKKALAEIFDELIYQYPLLKAIQDGWLSRIEYHRAQTEIPLDNIKTMAGDFQVGALSKRVNCPARNRACLEKYKALGGGKTIIFCVDVQHAENMADTFFKGGIEAKTISGTTSKNERREILSRFDQASSQEDLVLTNCMVLTEGWDCPDVRMVIMARPTQSEIVYLQQLGRGLRRAPGKKSVLLVDIVDHCSNPKLCNCLTTVFNLNRHLQIQGDLVAEIERRTQQYREPQEMDPQQFIRDQSDQMLFEVADPLEESTLEWYAPEEGQYFCQVTPGDTLQILNSPLDYELYWNTELLLKTADIDAILKQAYSKACAYEETRYLWDKTYRFSMKYKEVTLKQKKLLEKIAPQIDVDIIDREMASRIILAYRTKTRVIPPTYKQLYMIKILGYKGSTDKLTRLEADKILSRLRGKREG